MKNRGLTLVELLSVLVVLSIIALIVTPVITKNIRENKQDIYESQLESIKDAGISYAADHVDNVDAYAEDGLRVTLQELQSGGYIDENIIDTKNGGKFDQSKTFVLIEKDTNNNSNYASIDKYNFNAYADDADYVIKKLKEHLDNSSGSISTEYSLSEIIKLKLKEPNGGDYTINYTTAEVTVNSDGEYEITPK